MTAMTSRTLRKSVLPFATALALVVGAGTASAAKAPGLKPVNATYEVSYMGLGGTATMTLAPLEGDRWRYSLEIGSALAHLDSDSVGGSPTIPAPRSRAPAPRSRAARASHRPSPVVSGPGSRDACAGFGTD